jgi:hypothetical protein
MHTSADDTPYNGKIASKYVATVLGLSIAGLRVS